MSRSLLTLLLLALGRLQLLLQQGLRLQRLLQPLLHGLLFLQHFPMRMLLLRALLLLCLCDVCHAAMQLLQLGRALLYLPFHLLVLQLALLPQPRIALHFILQTLQLPCHARLQRCITL